MSIEVNYVQNAYLSENQITEYRWGLLSRARDISCTYVAANCIFMDPHWEHFYFNFAGSLIALKSLFLSRFTRLSFFDCSTRCAARINWSKEATDSLGTFFLI